MIVDIHHKKKHYKVDRRFVFTRQVAALFYVKWRVTSGHKIENMTTSTDGRRTFLSNFILIQSEMTEP